MQWYFDNRSILTGTLTGLTFDRTLTGVLECNRTLQPINFDGNFDKVDFWQNFDMWARMQWDFVNRSILTKLWQGVGCDRKVTGRLECNRPLTGGSILRELWQVVGCDRTLTGELECNRPLTGLTPWCVRF